MKKRITTIIFLSLLLSMSLFVSAASLQDEKEQTNFVTANTSGANETFSFLEQKTLAPELKSIVDINDSNILTMEAIKKMSDAELKKYSLLPVLDDEAFITKMGLRSGEEYSYFVTVWNFQQVETYYCGPAATLNVLATAGKFADIPGFTSEDKQRTLATTAYLCTDRDGGTWIEHIPPTLNHFDDRVRKWTRTTYTTSTSDKDSMEYWIRSNHSYGDQVIYLVKMKYLSYYPTTQKGSHYISGAGITYKTGSTTDYENIVLKLLDPNWNDDYWGTHYEPFNRVNEACYEYSRQVGPANFVY